MVSYEQPLPSPEFTPDALTYANAGATAEAYEATGNFTSFVPIDIGVIPDAETLIQATPIDKLREVPLEAAAIKFSNGTLDINRDSIGDDWSDRDIELVRAFEPTLLLIDADFRERAGLDSDTMLQPDITVVSGVYDEWQARSNGEPHLDQYGEQVILYFAALGAGTRIYPGEFYVDPSPASAVEPEDVIEAQVAEQGITPIELASGHIYAANWSTVHASPSEAHIGEERRFLRVTYAPRTIHEQPSDVVQVPAPQVESIQAQPAIW